MMTSIRCTSLRVGMRCRSGLLHNNKTCERFVEGRGRIERRWRGTTPASVAGPTGLFAGCVGGLCGVGGGIVIMPMLSTFTKMSAHKIVGTSLMSVSLAASVGACSYVSQGVGDVKIAALMTVSSFLTSKVGVYAGSLISGAALKRTMGCALMLFVPLVLAKTVSMDEVSETETDARQSTYEFVTSNSDYVGVGLVSGFAAGLLGLGGGIVSTTYMSGTKDMPQVEAVATSLIALVPTGLYSSVWHLRAGNVCVRSAGVLSVCCAAGMYVTSAYIAPAVDDAHMRKIFAFFLFLSGARMVMK